ncbi:hypothetical protein pEaSNUABM42_00063 [Erwinia phage pEa_SNUABM_42]|nr:hypothetical protein pEaSNUABM43_00063 [Erwinia phage pEa_SNUABM_43]QVW55380.1 hypothetical protein pEaSNUABM42_00063 [Erwinia phage pEa_SNUABM_42]
MTSMTEVGGLVSTAPQWRLGEMGNLLQEHMNHKISSLDQLNLYMQRNDADLLYGSRILAQVEAILEDVRRHGISRDLAVAVESTRPGTIPKNVQKILTSNYTGTHQRETVAALESWKEAGRMGLIILVLTAILKIISWIVESGKGYKGNTNPKTAADKVEEYKTKTDEKWQAAAEAPPPAPKSVKPDDWKREYESLADTLSCASVKAAYLEATKELSSRSLSQLTAAALRYDALIKNASAGDYIDTVTAVSGRNPIVPLLKDVASGEKGAGSVGGLVAELLRMNVSEGIFTPQAAAKAYSMLPKGMHEAGVRIPNESVFRMMANRAPELNSFFQSAGKGFDALSAMMSQKHEQNKWNDNDLHKPGTEFAHAMRYLNDYLATVIPVVKGGKFTAETSPTIAVVGTLSGGGLIGYDEPTEFLGNTVLVCAQYGAYLNSSFLSSYTERRGLNDDEAGGVLQALVVMANGLSTNSGVTNFNAYSKMEGEVKTLIDRIQTWEKSMSRSREGAHALQVIGAGLLSVMMEERSDSLNMGRELSADYKDQSSGDFWMGLRKNLNYIRRICMGTVGMQNIISKSQNNPFIKGKN